jgi:hypothetical protein
VPPSLPLRPPLLLLLLLAAPPLLLLPLLLLAAPPPSPMLLLLAAALLPPPLLLPAPPLLLALLLLAAPLPLLLLAPLPLAPPLLLPLAPPLPPEPPPAPCPLDGGGLLPQATAPTRSGATKASEILERPYRAKARIASSLDWILHQGRPWQCLASQFHLHRIICLSYRCGCALRVRIFPREWDARLTPRERW